MKGGEIVVNVCERWMALQEDVNDAELAMPAEGNLQPGHLWSKWKVIN